MPIRQVVSSTLIGLFLSACASEEAPPQSPPTEPEAPAEANPLRDAFFGDLHVHTRFSQDAFLFGTRASPDDAYRYAKGDEIDHVSGYKVRLESGPLDFYAVTDHGSYLGMLHAMTDPTSELSKLEVAKELHAATTMQERSAAYRQIRNQLGVEPDLDVVRSAWQETIAAAERHNDPGRFTTFIGYEYTSGPNSDNLHRNVIFQSARAPERPFSRNDSVNPEDLWAWMDGLRARGIEALAIPHNMNGSGGRMFESHTFEGEPLDAAYAATRMRNEPLVEISQLKGTSDTHPALSPNDEWADFEIQPYKIPVGSRTLSEPQGSYVRRALLDGLVMQATQGFNPYRFGISASSDTHNGATSAEEGNFFGKAGERDGMALARGSVPESPPGIEPKQYEDTPNRFFGAAGLTGAWAEQNTRASIYGALRRKETFGTSGPRIRLRFFAGYDLDDTLLDDPDRIAAAYEKGVPMGADLSRASDRVPRLLLMATQDPASAPLQRLQVIKGWVEGGEAREQVFDVACSDGGKPDSATHRCPDNGASVDLGDCSISEGKGAAELEALWVDPVFDPDQRAFYYVRVLENPTCRWSTWDALRAGLPPRPDLAATIQERAWSSPIWYRP